MEARTNDRTGDLTVEQFRALVDETVRESFEDILEDLAALKSKSYLESIEEARRDYAEGRVQPLEDVVGE